MADIDGGGIAIERNYNEHDLSQALLSFADARTENLQILRHASPETFEREGTLEGVGLVTLKQLIEMMVEHDESHMEDLRILGRRLKHASQPE